jgi:hypothetical protein
MTRRYHRAALRVDPLTMPQNDLVPLQAAAA